MSHIIGLYQDSALYGQIELDSLFVMGPADYTCQPKTSRQREQVQQIAKALRRSPEIHAGVIGRYDWREERN